MSQQAQMTPRTLLAGHPSVSNITGTSRGPTIPSRENTEAATPAPDSLMESSSTRAVGSHPEIA